MIQFLLLFFLFTSFCFSQVAVDSANGIFVTGDALVYSEKSVVSAEYSAVAQDEENVAMKKTGAVTQRKKSRTAAKIIKEETKIVDR